MSSSNDPERPVTVFRSNDPGVLALARSLLDGAGIEFFMAGEVVSGLYPGRAEGPFGTPEIRVASADAHQAREVLKELE
jgi:hypothetical protein